VRASTGLDMLRLAPRLRPMFVTRFERKAAPLALGHGVRAEACIDRGAIEAGRAREPILELELELLEGELGPLIASPRRWSSPRPACRAGEQGRARLSPRELGEARAARQSGRARRSTRTPRATPSPRCAPRRSRRSRRTRPAWRAATTRILHQLRVGVRRLLSAVRAFRPLLKRKRAEGALRRCAT